MGETRDMTMKRKAVFVCMGTKWWKEVVWRGVEIGKYGMVKDVFVHQDITILNQNVIFVLLEQGIIEIQENATMNVRDIKYLIKN